jgi:hypothetical protein
MHIVAIRVLPAIFAAVIALSLSAAAFAQEIVSASPDVTIDLGAGVIAADETVAIDNQLGLVVLENLGPLPDASEVVALGHDVNGDRLIAFETTTALAGGAGLPNGVATDATSLSAGGMLFSFDTTVDLGGGLVVADEDLVEWNGSSFALLFDGSAEGVDSALDIDGAQDVGGGQLLMSFDTTGQIAGLVFDDEDVLRFDGSAWTLEFDASAANPAWAAADLDAVMVPEPAMSILLAAGAFWVSVLRRRC